MRGSQLSSTASLLARPSVGYPWWGPVGVTLWTVLIPASFACQCDTVYLYFYFCFVASLFLFVSFFLGFSVAIVFGHLLRVRLSHDHAGLVAGHFT